MALRPPSVTPAGWRPAGPSGERAFVLREGRGDSSHPHTGLWCWRRALGNAASCVRARACVHASVCGYACTRVCKRACAARTVLWLGSGLELRGVSSRFCWSPDCWSPEPPGATCPGWAHGSRTVPGGALRWVSKLIPRGAPGSRLHPHVAGCLLCATRRLGGAGRCPHGLALGWGGRREGNATVDLAQGGPLEGTAPGQA